MNGAALPERADWKRDVSAYLLIDRGRSLRQIASVVPPYLAVWVLAAVIQPDAALAVGLGLVATVFLVRMYSLFHDLTHNSLFESRAANGRWGHLLGYLLFTPYRWWQRQHSLHHANTGNLDGRGPGEIYTMTLGEYQAASWARRLVYRAYRNPLLLLFVANPGNNIVDFVYSVTEPFVAPFRGMFSFDQVTAGDATLDVAAVVALIGWLLIYLLLMAILNLGDRRRAA